MPGKEIYLVSAYKVKKMIKFPTRRLIFNCSKV